MKVLKMILPLVVLVAGGSTFVLLEVLKPDPEKKNELPRPVSVFVTPARASDVALRIVTHGEVRPRTDVTIVSQVAGRVASVSPEFTEGGVVTRNAALIVIEDIDYQLALKRAEARVAAAEVVLEQSLADADVARRQLENVTRASDLALKKPQVVEAKAGLAAAEADLALAELNLSRTRISMPFDGRIQTTSVSVGQYVTPGIVLGRAFAQDMVEVRLPLSDSQLASLDLPPGYVAKDTGLPVNFSAEVAGQQHMWVGSLTRLDASFDPATRTIHAIAQIVDPYGDGRSQHGMPLAVGLYVEAEVRGREIIGATVIPRQGLRSGNQVYLLDDLNKLDVRTVEVIHSDPLEAVIGVGVEPGNSIIMSAIRNPIQGMALNTSDSQLALRQATQSDEEG